MVKIALDAGSRAFITGSSGSGKTTMALSLCEVMPSPLVIIDTKYDPGIKQWGKERGIPFATKRMPDWRKIKSDVIVRPPPEWIANPYDIDWWLGQAFYCKYIPSIYIDEGYQVGATTTRMGEGITGLWTRGRAFGFRSMIGAQKPSWLSTFAISESDVFFIGMLTVAGDRKKLADMIGYSAILEQIERRRFNYIKQGTNKPVLLEPLAKDRAVLYGDKDYRLSTRKRLVK